MLPPSGAQPPRTYRRGMTTSTMNGVFGAVLGNKCGIADAEPSERDTNALAAFLGLAEGDGECLWSRMLASHLLLFYERELLGSVEVAANADGRLTASKLVLSVRGDLSEDAQRIQAEVASMASPFGVTIGPRYRLTKPRQQAAACCQVRRFSSSRPQLRRRARIRSSVSEARWRSVRGWSGDDRARHCRLL